MRTPAPRAWTRRSVLQSGLASAALLGVGSVLSACGEDDSEGLGAVTIPPIEGELRIFSFQDYTSPRNVEIFSRASGVDVQIDTFKSNEALIERLDAGAAADYDVIVASGVYVPTLLTKGHLAAMDTTRLTRFDAYDPKYLNQPWDLGNAYSVPKAWGTTGFIYDTTVVERTMTSWADLFEIAKAPSVSGRISMLDSPRDLIAPAAWANGISWATTVPEELDRIEQILVEDLAPHVDRLESFAPDALADGIVLAHAWNGDARAAMLDDPDRYAWVIPEPLSDLWIDSWCISSKARNVDAAYAWIDYVLSTDAAIRDITLTGFDSGLDRMRVQLEGRTELLEVIYSDASQDGMLEPGVVNEAQPRIQQIYDRFAAVVFDRLS